MSTIRSSIGESKFAGQRRLVVEEPDQASIPVSTGHNNSQFGKQIDASVVAGLRQRAQEQQEQQEQMQLSDARRRVDIIVGIGRQIKDVVALDGSMVFTLRTLKLFEQNCLAEVIEQSERLQTSEGLVFTPTSMNKIRVEALSHSLFLIDGKNIDIVLGTSSASYEEQVEARKSLIQEMDFALINYLYKNYEDLTKHTYDGYMPKTSEEAKEVVETISKSGQNI